MNQPRQGQDAITAEQRRFYIEIAPDHYELDRDAIEEERAERIRSRQEEAEDKEQP